MDAASDPAQSASREGGEVTSSDGTTIGYARVGHGPSVVLLHGAGQSSGNLSKLANDLSDAFTVYVPDRRGRGRSPSYGDFRGLRSEVEDLSALIDSCGARRVFGLSAGAVIAIETALVRPEITKLALYEPPLSFDGVMHGAWAGRYERELDRGRPGAALAAVLKATADRGVLRYVPFAALSCDVLLLGGSRSARDLRASLDGLAAVLPRAKKVVLGGVGHTAADNSSQPQRVAAELRAFFA